MTITNGREYAIGAVEDYHENLKLFIDEKSAKKFARDFPNLMQYDLQNIARMKPSPPSIDVRNVDRDIDLEDFNYSDPESINEFGRKSGSAFSRSHSKKLRSRGESVFNDASSNGGGFESGKESNRRSSKSRSGPSNSSKSHSSGEPQQSQNRL